MDLRLFSAQLFVPSNFRFREKVYEEVYVGRFVWQQIWLHAMLIWPVVRTVVTSHWPIATNTVLGRRPGGERFGIALSGCFEHV
jgi:hypothetical protein